MLEVEERFTPLGCFEHPLYDCEDVPSEQINPAIRDISEITDQALPRRLISVAADKWVARAARYLSSSSLKARYPSARCLGIQPQISLVNNVSVAVALYTALIGPVATVMSSQSVNFTSTSPDALHTIFKTNNDGDAPTIHMVVYGRDHNHINIEKYQAAITKSGLAEQSTLDNCNKDAFFETDFPEFWDLKQVCAAATKYNTTHVALCDYESLLLFELERAPDNRD